MKIYPISQIEDHAITGVWHQFRENPAGTELAYVNFRNNIPQNANDERIAEIWLCSVSGENHRFLSRTGLVNDHNGANLYWIDNDRIIYHSRNHEGRIECKVISSRTGELLQGPFLDWEVRNFNEKKGLAPLIRRPGPYCEYAQLALLDVETGIVQNLMNALELSKEMKGSDFGNNNPANWEFFLQFINPEGSRIAWIVNTGNHSKYDPAARNRGSEGTIQYLVSCDLDGNRIRHFGRKDYHQYWWDNDSLFGFDEPGGTYRATVRDLEGNVRQVLFDQGNHGSCSPDFKWFASDLPYGQKESLKLHRLDRHEPPVTIEDFDYAYEYGHRLHIDPSFSRDGKRIYYNKIVDTERLQSRIFACDISD